MLTTILLLPLFECSLTPRWRNPPSSLPSSLPPSPSRILRQSHGNGHFFSLNQPYYTRPEDFSIPSYSPPKPGESKDRSFVSPSRLNQESLGFFPPSSHISPPSSKPRFQYPQSFPYPYDTPSSPPSPPPQPSLTPPPVTRISYSTPQEYTISSTLSSTESSPVPSSNPYSGTHSEYDSRTEETYSTPTTLNTPNPIRPSSIPPPFSSNTLSPYFTGNRPSPPPSYGGNEEGHRPNSASTPGHYDTQSTANYPTLNPSNQYSTPLQTDGYNTNTKEVPPTVYGPQPPTDNGNRGKYPSEWDGYSTGSVTPSYTISPDQYGSTIDHEDRYSTLPTQSKGISHPPAYIPPSSNDRSTSSVYPVPYSPSPFPSPPSTSIPSTINPSPTSTSPPYGEYDNGYSPSHPTSVYPSKTSLHPHSTPPLSTPTNVYGGPTASTGHFETQSTANYRTLRPSLPPPYGGNEERHRPNIANTPANYDTQSTANYPTLNPTTKYSIPQQTDGYNTNTKEVPSAGHGPQPPKDNGKEGKYPSEWDGYSTRTGSLTPPPTSTPSSSYTTGQRTSSTPVPSRVPPSNGIYSVDCIDCEGRPSSISLYSPPGGAAKLMIHNKTGVASPPSHNPYSFFSTTPPDAHSTASYDQPPPPPGNNDTKVINNRIKGMAHILCMEKGVEVNALTVRPFDGTVSTVVDGKRKCVNSFSGTSTNVSVFLSFEECGMRKKNAHNSSSEWETQVVFTFPSSEDSFLVQCHTQSLKHDKSSLERTFEESLEEFQLIPIKIEQKAPLPYIEWSLTENNVTEVDIGTQQVMHFNLTPYTEAYGFHVRNCYVIDQKNGERHSVIDRKGCSSDMAAFTHPQYNTLDDTMTSDWMAFKLPDHDTLHISCSYSICPDFPSSSADNSSFCSTIPTPPLCPRTLMTPFNSLSSYQALTKRDTDGEMTQKVEASLPILHSTVTSHFTPFTPLSFILIPTLSSTSILIASALHYMSRRFQ